MTERILITKLVRHDDRADLIGKGHQYKDLTLFSLSDLADVGIDYAALENGVETPCRFWAIYELSEKLNKANRPYRDIIALEAIDKPATATSAAVGDPAVLAEIRAIRQLLEVISEDMHLTPRPIRPIPEPEPDPGPTPSNGNGDTPLSDQPPPPEAEEDHLEEFFAEQEAKAQTTKAKAAAKGEPEPEPAKVLYGCGVAVGDNEDERKAFSEYVKAEGCPPLDIAMLRTWALEQKAKAKAQSAKPAKIR